MTRLSPVSRRELVRRLRELGFEGPYAGGNHEFMLRGASGQRLILPNPHRGLVGVDLLAACYARQVSRVMSGSCPEAHSREIIFPLPAN